MKSFLCLCLVVCTTIAVPPENTERIYPRYIEFPNEDGSTRTVDLEEQPDMKFLDDISRDPANNRYFLYTRRNPFVSQTLRFNNTQSITLSNFNADNPTVVIAHGWLGHKDSSLNPTVKNAYLLKSDVNVIVMDWSALASKFYTTSLVGVPVVGRGLGQFLDFLHSVTRAPFEKMHLIGFSLGAHLVGNAGRELQGRVARITGLDPAGPLWHFNPHRMRSSDAIQVDAIHTDGGLLGLGIGTAVADADFFPNGGIAQPGCTSSGCNHGRAFEFFAASVTYNHLLGIQCSNMNEVISDTCSGRIFHMGNDDLNKRGSGLYRVSTHRRYPF